MAKTLVFMEMYGQEASFFFELEGDYSRLDNVLINAMAPKGVSRKAYEKLVDELSALLYGPEGRDLLTEERKLLVPTKDWDFFVRCGFVP